MVKKLPQRMFGNCLVTIAFGAGLPVLGVAASILGGGEFEEGLHIGSVWLAADIQVLLSTRPDPQTAPRTALPGYISHARVVRAARPMLN